MKILKQAELPAVAKKGRNTMVSVYLQKLEVGESLQIDKADWRSSGTPYRIVNYLAKKENKSFQKFFLADGSGWLITRIL